MCRGEFLPVIGREELEFPPLFPPLQSCDSKMLVKENPNRKTLWQMDLFSLSKLSLLVTIDVFLEVLMVDSTKILEKDYPIYFQPQSKDQSYFR